MESLEITRAVLSASDKLRSYILENDDLKKIDLAVDLISDFMALNGTVLDAVRRLGAKPYSLVPEMDKTRQRLLRWQDLCLSLRVTPQSDPSDVLVDKFHYPEVDGLLIKSFIMAGCDASRAAALFEPESAAHVYLTEKLFKPMVSLVQRLIK